MKTKRHNKTYNSNAQIPGPVFIHSLWRAGSTYLFSAFRRSPSGYWCYQEPIHELALYCKDSPENLNSDAIVSPEVLRHPPLDKPYFQELFKVWPEWRDDIHKQIIYDAYFGEADNDGTIRYLNKIIKYSKGRAVIQECRTASRINTLKSALGGYHIYLWRNPWDQWWSYKATHYFDITSQLILNTTVHPEAITRLRQEIGFSEFHHEDLAAEISYFNDNRLSAEHSYLTFYLLWCLGLLEGCEYADYMVNIDVLSDSRISREITIKHLEDCGIPGIDFFDCKISQTYYTQDEEEFFVTLEERVHGILLLSGYTQKQLNDLQELRKQNEPHIWSAPVSAIPQVALLSQASRSRDIVIRHESEHASRLNERNNQLLNIGKQAERLSIELNSATTREANLNNQLAIERESIGRLQHELESITTQQTIDTIHAQQSLEDTLNQTIRQQAEYAQREHELMSQIQNSQQMIICLQDTLVQREHFITELHDKYNQTVQDEQHKYFDSVKLIQEMQQNIDQLNAEINAYRKEISTYHENTTRTQSYLSDLFAGIKQIEVSSGFAFTDCDSTAEHLSEGVSTHATTNLTELLLLHDKQFVTSAYQSLLGRLPDPEGFQYYLGRLRSGISKYEILAQMRFSKEGKAC